MTFRILKSVGIDPRRYRILVGLWRILSERGEMLDQLGGNGIALRTVGWMYGAFSAFLAIVMAAMRPSSDVYLSTFLVLTAVLLSSILLSETGNSLVNPVEALVLAHQPIDGVTYTAAKLTHLVRILLFLVPALNGVPAIGGLLLKRASWIYPLVHMAAAFVIGAIAALLCCAAYGWLIRLVPASRLKTAAQLAATVPFVAMFWQRLLRSWILNLLGRLPAAPAWRWAFGAAAGIASVVIVVLGIRALSGAYLTRLSESVSRGSTAAAGPRSSLTGRLISRLFGGQTGRAGFAFVSCMMRRDFQFRRQVLPIMVLGVVGIVPSAASAWRIDPFSGKFTPVHILPHVIALVLFFVCNVLPYGSDHKGVWLFLAAPGSAFGGFARGVWGSLCLPFIVAPHAILLPLLAAAWGPWHAALFIAYSTAVAFLYLSLELRLIDGAPFTQPFDAARSATGLPFLFVVCALVAIGAQVFLIFPSFTVVTISTVIAGIAAWRLTRSALRKLEASISFGLGLISRESRTFYKEVNV